MPRNPDTPCAGGCGKMLWHSYSTSQPRGLQTCRACRDAGRAPMAPRYNYANRVCDVDGCGEKHLAGGFCRSHYYKARRAAGLEHRNHECFLPARVFKFGAFAPTIQNVKCRATVGLMVQCPCGDWTAAASPALRTCVRCGTELRLNAEEVGVVAQELRAAS